MKTKELTAIRCVKCGKFMNCEDPDAHCKVTPDSDYSVESVRWSCGPCTRREQEG